MSQARYDDEHRGPGVPGAMHLGECWRLLAERNLPWPEPVTQRGRGIESVIRGTYPTDQVDRAIAEHRRSDGTVDVLREALLSGDLPVWVASWGAPETLVAPGALIELGRETIISGIYRPPNDRGGLYGRPLFVKRIDFEAWLGRFGSERERSADEWIRAHAGQNSTKAWERYRSERPNGVKRAVFMEDWRSIHKRSRGRPSK